MKNQELFDRTVGILVKAYLNNTLTPMHPCGCAVGNLVAANCGFKMSLNDKNEPQWDTPNGKVTDPYWNNLVHNTGSFYEGSEFSTELAKQKREIALSDLRGTGYSEKQTFKIEMAFEGYGEFAYNKDSRDSRVFNGLMRVVDYLMEIHEATTEEITQAKSLFKKELAEVG